LSTSTHFPCPVFNTLSLSSVQHTSLVQCSTHFPCPVFNTLSLSSVQHTSLVQCSTHCSCPVQHTALVHFNTLPLSNVHHTALVYFKTFTTLFFTLRWYTAHHAVLTQCPLSNNNVYFVFATLSCPPSIACVLFSKLTIPVSSFHCICCPVVQQLPFVNNQKKLN
jgi:hypothetical protein